MARSGRPYHRRQLTDEGVYARLCALAGLDLGKLGIGIGPDLIAPGDKGCRLCRPGRDGRAGVGRAGRAAVITALARRRVEMILDRVAVVVDRGRNRRRHMDDDRAALLAPLARVIDQLLPLRLTNLGHGAERQVSAIGHRSLHRLRRLGRQPPPR